MQLASLCTTFHAQTRAGPRGAAVDPAVKRCSTPTRSVSWLEWGVSPDGPALPTPPSAALDAFVQGVSVRSWVLARQQAGDAARADRLLDEAIARFTAGSAQRPLAQWPLAWWNALLEDPGMLVPAQPTSDDPLRRLPPGPRAALLLRFVAGLDLPHAAQALGVSQASHDAALDQALRAPGLEGIGVEAVRTRLHDEVQALSRAQRVRVVPGAAPTPLARAALPRSPSSDPQAVPPSAPSHALAIEAPAAPGVVTATPIDLARAPGWRQRAARQRTGVLVGLAILGGALALSLWWRRPVDMAPGAREALPAEAVAPAPPLDAAHAVTHPDYAQLAHPEDERLARDLAFFSWLAASTVPQGPAAAATGAAGPDVVPSDLRTLLAPVAGAWAGLDAASRARLVEQATDWRDRDPAARTALLRALQDWDRLPATERARRREPMAAWQELGAVERAQVVAAAHAFAARGIGEQTDLRLQFGALPDDAQHLWRLGPALGPELTDIAPLFAFLPERERPALLAALRTLDLESRRRLALLAPRLSEAGRDELRRDLVRTPAAQRAALIASRVGPG